MKTIPAILDNLLLLLINYKSSMKRIIFTTTKNKLTHTKQQTKERERKNQVVTHLVSQTSLAAVPLILCLTMIK
jgi:hypothetical protein